MKLFGLILLLAGLVALAVTGIDYINESKSFSLLGVDVMVSKGEIIPVVVSGLVFLAGLILFLGSKKK